MAIYFDVPTTSPREKNEMFDKTYDIPKINIVRVAYED